MSSKRLIILIENYVSGGANKYAEDIINCLVDDYAAVEIWGNKEAIASFSRNRLPPATLFKEIQIFNQSEKIKNFKKPLRIFLRLALFPFTVLKNFFSLLSLKSHLDKIQEAKVILCNGGYPASLYLIFSAFFISERFKPSMTIVSTPARKSGAFWGVFWKFIDQKLSNKIKIFAVNSSAIKNELKSKCGFEEQSIKIVRNGVADTPVKRSENKEKITIGFISRVEASKGIEELLEAYKRLRSGNTSIELIIAGSGSLENKVAAAAALDNSIKVLGHVSPDQVNDILSQIDIFVLPSYQEGLPYSVIEACMAKCAIVATNVGGIPEIIKNEFNGLLVPPSNIDLLAAALKRLIENRELRTTLSSNARATFLNEFSLEKMRESARTMI